jgi:hypothetical protein
MGDLKGPPGASAVHLYPVHSTFHRRLRPRHVARILREMEGSKPGLISTPELIDLMPALQKYVPPAKIINKPVYSAFATGVLPAPPKRSSPVNCWKFGEDSKPWERPQPRCAWPLRGSQAA